MKNDPQDIFRAMDQMMARLVADMESGMEIEMPPGIRGFHIIIRGGDLPHGTGGDRSGESAGVREPVPEVHRIGDEVRVIADLPGITQDALRLEVKDGGLVIDAGDADLHYHTVAVLPPVDAASMQTSLKNGVLEVTFHIPAGDRQEGGATKTTDA